MPAPNSTNIPVDEQEKFAKHLFFYFQNDTIIREGQDDHDVYLLREGSLAVEKTIAGKSTRISTIEAVNFFGEMAIVVRAKRTATVRVLSEQAIVYRFHFSDLKAIYTNPAWSELLIARLCNDLVETNKRAASLETETQLMLEKNTQSEDQLALLFSALLSLQKDVAADVVLNTKAWVLLKGMRELTETYLKNHLPGVSNKINRENRSALNRLSATPDFPDILKPLL